MEYNQIVKYNGSLGRVVREGNKFYFLPAKYGSYTCSSLDEITDDTIEPITFDEKIKCIEQEFNWGSVIKTHIIGEYQIIESMCINRVARFHPYINFRDYHHTYSSLDIALIGAVAMNTLEANEARYATTCILRILKKPEW